LISSFEPVLNETITCFVHPNTYLNKILIGTVSGNIYIFNIKTRKVVYRIEHGSEIISLTRSPALDIVAIVNGRNEVILHNFYKDKVVFRIQIDENVQSVSFRTDSVDKMAIATKTGNILIVDLDKAEMSQIIKNAHRGSIVYIRYIPNNPILISVGEDNSIKEWIFDEDVFRLLCDRKGHVEPLTKIMFYDDDGHFMLSSGRDGTFRNFSLFKDSQSTEFSSRGKNRGNGLNSIIKDFSFSFSRSRDWDNIVTCSDQKNYVLTWSYETHSIGKHKIVSRDQSIIECVYSTNCGNLIVLGTRSGGIEVYNIQSGLFQYRMEESTQIIGIYTGVGNRVLVSLIRDGIGFWNLKTRRKVNDISVKNKIHQFAFSPVNELVATSNDYGSINIYSLDTRKELREWKDVHTHMITQMVFSKNGKNIYSSSMDCTISVLNIVNGEILDVIRFGSIPISLTISSTEQILGVALSDSIGIHLLVNSSMYSVQSIKSRNLIEPPNTHYQCKFYTLTDKGICHWRNLINLDLIKERNRPIEPPKKQEGAPFFLGSKSEDARSDGTGNSHILKLDVEHYELDSEFMIRLADGFEEFEEYLKGLSMSAIDLGINMLSSRLCIRFIRYLKNSLERKNNFDMIQTLLNVFIKSQEQNILSSFELREELKNVRIIQEEACLYLEELFQNSLCFINIVNTRV
jgi:U3 small nucleolar RNA-associated protein 21